jgi:membrane protein implicated in regulation of membrane protease activity
MSLGNNSSQSRPEPEVPPTDMRKMALAGVLLAIPIVVLLWVPHYAKVEPTLFGFPFFFWYQFLWVFLCSAMTYTAFRLTLSARGKTSHKAGEDR